MDYQSISQHDVTYIVQVELHNDPIQFLVRMFSCYSEYTSHDSISTATAGMNGLITIRNHFWFYEMPTEGQNSHLSMCEKGHCLALFAVSNVYTNMLTNTGGKTRKK